MLELEQFLPYRLSVLSNRISQAIARIYQQRFGLDVTEWRIMAVLGRYPGASAGEVAERTAMDKVAISRGVSRLLERRLITRDIHEDDRRRSVLALSDAGLAVYEEIAPLALDYERRLLAELAEDEREWLQRLLARLDAIGVPAV